MGNNRERRVRPFSLRTEDEKRKPGKTTLETQLNLAGSISPIIHSHAVFLSFSFFFLFSRNTATTISDSKNITRRKESIYCNASRSRRRVSRSKPSRSSSGWEPIENVVTRDNKVRNNRRVYRDSLAFSFSSRSRFVPLIRARGRKSRTRFQSKAFTRSTSKKR